MAESQGRCHKDRVRGALCFVQFIFILARRLPGRVPESSKRSGRPLETVCCEQAACHAVVAILPTGAGLFFLLTSARPKRAASLSTMKNCLVRNRRRKFPSPISALPNARGFAGLPCGLFDCQRQRW